MLHQRIQSIKKIRRNDSKEPRKENQPLSDAHKNITKKKTDGNMTIQDLRIEFNKEIETLRKTQAKINMKLKTL